MLAAIVKILRNIVIGLLVVYLCLSWIVLPLLAPWVASAQATKILKHPVKVKSVWLNPFLWRLTIGHAGIYDGENLMAGFERLTVDVSFLKLLAREYRIEDLTIVGLNINAVLTPQGTIDLLTLVPAAPSSTAKAPQPAEPTAVPSVSSTPTVLPKAVIKHLALHNGAVRFTDTGVTPPFNAILDRIEWTVQDVSTDPTVAARSSLTVRLNERGLIRNDATFKPLAQPLELETSFTLNSYAMQVLSPYVGKYTGHAVKDGNLDFKMDYRIGGNKLTASHKILVQRFDFGEKVASKDALPLPFGLAVALLEDPQGRIDISLPVTGDMSDPEFHYLHLVGQVARNFFMKLLTKPFAFLASAVGMGGGASEEDLGNIRFAPGVAEFSTEEQAKLEGIIKALKDRPRVSLEVKGSYDPQVDWKAMKARVFDDAYKTLREESKRRELEVYKQLYQRRFGLKDLWTLARRFHRSDGRYDEEEFRREIKRRLVEDGSADQVALEALGASRARVVYDFLIQNGFEPKRLALGAPRTSVATNGSVPLELVLNVYDTTSPPAQKPVEAQP